MEMKVKQNVLEQIMSLMDEMEGEKLKSKSPKFMKIQMGEVKPIENENSPVEKLMESKEEESELDDEMIQKLEEMLKNK